jgi:hypothetical protein
VASNFIPFEEVEELATIERLAQMLNLDIRRSGAQWRCECPAHPGHHRDLCISPQVKSKRGSLGVFFCQREKTGGDRIGLVAHVMDIGQQDAAIFIAQQFGMTLANNKNSTSDSTVSTVSKGRATVPPAEKSEGRSQPASSRAEFDPQAFASKLEYTHEVAALGIIESDAELLGIGMYRGKVYIAMRYDNGDIAGFAAVEAAKLPSKLLPYVAGNVVVLKQRA